MAHLNAGVPADYLALLAETDGFIVESLRFYGTKARRLILSDLNLVVLAENDEAALCVRQGRHEPHVLLYDHINDERVEGGDSLVRALEMLLGTSAAGIHRSSDRF